MSRAALCALPLTRYQGDQEVMGPMDEQPPGTRDQSGATDGPLGCYRHPGRETGIRCTRCDRPICTECMVSASVGFQCPDCVRQGSGTGHGPAANQPRTLAGGTVTADPRLVTKILLALNVALFVVVHVKPALLPDLTLFGRANLYYGGPPEGVAEGQWYRLVTSMFLHQEVWHIAFNMLGLWWLGGPWRQRSGAPATLRSICSPAWRAALSPTGWPHRISPHSVPPAPSSVCWAPPPCSCAA